MLPESLPEKTLGWGVLNWCSRWLAQPDGDRKGDRWVFTNEQARFILHFYAVDEYGKFVYRRGVLERPKGWGKSPLLAAICSCELLGPVRFSHFDDSGNPVGRPYPSAYIQIAAISEDQTDNTMSLVGEMLSGDAQRRYSLDIGLSRVLAPGRRKLDRVTASFRSREGNRPTFVVMDETHLWVPAEKGPELAGVLRRNLAKTRGRSIETTNAPVPGEGSVAETSHDAYEQIVAGTSFDNALLFDSRQVIVKDVYDKEETYPALVTVYGDAAHPQTGWIDLDRIWAEINDPATKEHDARRYYLNERVYDAAQWIKAPEWDAAKRDDLKLNPKKDKLALGYSGVMRNGAAALVACRITDGALFLLGFWEKPENDRDWEVPVHDVDARVRKWMKRENVFYLCVNPRTIQDVAGRWSVDHEDRVEGIWIEMKARQSKMVDQFEEALYGGRLVHTGDLDLKRHVMNSFVQEVTEGYILKKEFDHSKRYINAAQAALLAYEACQIAIENGALDEPPDKNVYGFGG